MWDGDGEYFQEKVSFVLNVQEQWLVNRQQGTMGHSILVEQQHGILSKHGAPGALHCQTGGRDSGSALPRFPGPL